MKNSFQIYEIFFDFILIVSDLCHFRNEHLVKGILASDSISPLIRRETSLLPNQSSHNSTNYSRNFTNMDQEMREAWSYQNISVNHTTIDSSINTTNRSSFNKSTSVSIAEMVPSISSLIFNFISYYFNFPCLKLVESIFKTFFKFFKFRQLWSGFIRDIISFISNHKKHFILFFFIIFFIYSLKYFVYCYLISEPNFYSGDDFNENNKLLDRYFKRYVQSGIS